VCRASGVCGGDVGGVPGIDADFGWVPGSAIFAAGIRGVIASIVIGWHKQT
jgi:hypothetical protein